MIVSSRLFWGVFLAVSIGLVGVVRADLPRVERYEGVARDGKGAIVYREKHEVEYRDGRLRKAVTRYLASDGREIATLESEFPGNTSLPKYRFKNLIAGYEEGVECCAGEQLEVFHRGERKKMSFQSSWVSGQGFHYLVQERLGQVDQGKNQEFKFLIPSKMTAYDFRIRSGGRDPLNPRLTKVLLEIDQWFFRLFAPKIVATYDLETRRLMSYEGPSNIENEKGDVPSVRIEYTY